MRKRISEWFVAEVRRDESIHKMEFSRGKTTQDPRDCRIFQVDGHENHLHARRTNFYQETREFKFDVLAKRLRELAFLNPGVKIVLKDDKDNRSNDFLFEDGIGEYVIP